MISDFDASRAQFKGPDFFKRFVVEGEGQPLSSLDLPPETQLIVAERGDARHGFLLKELSRPHMAQGRLRGEPYLVSF